MNSTDPRRPDWHDDSVDDLLRAFGLLRSDEERAAFLRDLCTLAEIQAMAHRLAAARLSIAACRTPRWPSASAARPRRSRASPTGCATARAATASCSTAWPGSARDRAAASCGSRCPPRAGSPSPRRGCSSDAGIQFETTGRTLHAHAHDLDLDLLLARSDDIPVLDRAGDVDLGIAGQNQIVETGADVEPLLELGFGRCRLALAVPEGAAIRSLADLDGARIATSYPRTVAARLASAGVDASVVTLGGSVELAPRLHAADAIVDLVSSGDTLRQNGLSSSRRCSSRRPS